MSQIREEEHEASFFALSMACLALPSYVVKAMIELEVFEIIKKSGPEAQLSAAQIAAQLPTSNPDAAEVLDRMLRLLASFSVLTFTLRPLSEGQSERVYGLAPVCKFFTKDEDGVSFAPLSLLAHDKVFTDVWSNFKGVVLEGGVAFNKTHGMSIFEYCRKDSRFYNTFFNAMSNHSTIVLRKILEEYKGFEGLSSLVDVGGGTGDSVAAIVAKYPMIKTINFDLPHVVQNAPSIPGVEHVGGDMYVSIPKGDAIFMKWVLHMGSDEECVRVLKNCYEALPKDGKVIVCEYIAPEVCETSHKARMVFSMDAIMLGAVGGRERTMHEYQAMAKQAGFQAFHVFCDSLLIEFHK